MVGYAKLGSTKVPPAMKHERGAEKASRLLDCTCLLYSVEGGEAVLFIPQTTDFLVYTTTATTLPSDAKTGMWFRVKYQISQSGQHVTIREAFRAEDVMPTRTSAGLAQILLCVTDVKDEFVCPYGSVNYMENARMREKIRDSTGGIMAWCTLDRAYMRTFNVVELKEATLPTNANLPEPKKGTVEVGVVGRVTATSVSFIMLRPDTHYYVYQLRKTDFPDALDSDSLGSWYRLWLTTADNAEEKRCRQAEKTAVKRPTRILDGQVQIAVAISIHPVTGFLVCEFGRLVMPNEKLRDLIRLRQQSRYWCTFDTSGAANDDYRLRVLGPEVPPAAGEPAPPLIQNVTFADACKAKTVPYFLERAAFFIEQEDNEKAAENLWRAFAQTVECYFLSIGIYAASLGAIGSLCDMAIKAAMKESAWSFSGIEELQDGLFIAETCREYATDAEYIDDMDDALAAVRIFTEKFPTLDRERTRSAFVNVGTCECEGCKVKVRHFDKSQTVQHAGLLCSYDYFVE